MTQHPPSHSPFQLDDTVYQQYLAHLVNGNSAECIAIVSQLLEQQIDIKDLYVHLFQRSLYQVGVLWEQNKISVAREHLATAITERVMNLVYPRLFSSSIRKRKKAIVSCAANEYHQIGGKMAADILELNHWDTHFLGANTPTEQLLEHIQEESVSLAGLSLGVYFNMPSLLQMIHAINGSFPKLQIIVGGQGFLMGGIDKLKPFSTVTYCSSIFEMETIVGEGNA